MACPCSAFVLLGVKSAGLFDPVLALDPPGEIEFVADALGMGRVLSGSQSAEDLMRELRMSPMLQLGVNYSF